MTVKEIIGACLDKMGLGNFIDDTNYTIEESKIANKLLVALNTAYLGRACDYLKQTTKENVAVNENGEIFPSVLEKVIVNPVSLRDDIGVKHSYSIYPDRLKTDFSGVGVLEYAYLPSKLTLAGSVDDMRMTADMLSDGALAEYYFTLRSFDLSSAYEEQFRSKLTSAKYKGREIVLKERRWGA